MIGYYIPEEVAGICEWSVADVWARLGLELPFVTLRNHVVLIPAVSVPPFTKPSEHD